MFVEDGFIWNEMWSHVVYDMILHFGNNEHFASLRSFYYFDQRQEASLYTLQTRVYHKSEESLCPTLIYHGSILPVLWPVSYLLGHELC
jgi:hypothetical protein